MTHDPVSVHDFHATLLARCCATFGNDTGDRSAWSGPVNLGQSPDGLEGRVMFVSTCQLVVRPHAQSSTHRRSSVTPA